MESLWKRFVAESERDATIDACRCCNFYPFRQGEVKIPVSRPFPPWFDESNNLKAEYNVIVACLICNYVDAKNVSKADVEPCAKGCSADLGTTLKLRAKRKGLE